jgi:hypothetical protein
MSIPPEFNETEHFQSVVRRYLNKEIREAFQDLGGDDWQPEVGTTRGSMRHALTHKDNDTLQMTMGRMFLYYFTYGGAKALQAPTVIDMTDRLYEDFVYRPEVKLFFYKKVYLGDKKYDQFVGEISYKLINETSATITPTENRRRAERIKNLFATPSRFVWHKGKLKFTYLDIPNGYDLRILASNETEARRIIEQVLDIENKTPNWDKLSTNTPERQSTTTTQKRRIYGEERNVPRWRPTAEVPFLRATMKIHGIPTPVPLVECISGIPIVQVPN